MKAIRTTRKKNGQTMLCPYFSEHYGGCLSTNMHNMSLASVVDHCGSHYESCSVYQKFSRTGQVADYAGPCLGCADATATKDCALHENERFFFVPHERRIYS